MTYQFRQQRAAEVIRSHDPGDRRVYRRFTDGGMVARLGAQLLDVHDLSIGGLRISRCAVAPGAVVSFELIPREGRSLLLPKSVVAKGEIVSQCDSWSRVHFVGMTFSLAKFLIQHMARLQGVQPYIFK